MRNEKHVERLESLAAELDKAMAFLNPPKPGETHWQELDAVSLRAGAAALDEVAALRRDAARYRWLRGRTNVWRDILDGHYRVGFSPLTVSAIEKGKDPACNVLDTAIDAAILEAPNA